MSKLARRIAATLRRRSTAADAVLAGVFFAAGLVSVYASFETGRLSEPHYVEPAKWPIMLMLLAVTLPLAWRRRFPLLSASAVAAAFLVGRLTHLLDVFDEQYISVSAVYLALYSAAAHRRRTRMSTLALGVLVVAGLVEVVRELFFGHLFPRGLPLTHGVLVAYNTVVLLLPLVLGATIRSLRERQRELAAQTAELQAEREENARRAVLEERVRIARELHDVVAHHVSVMGVQAGAARRVMGRQPDKAEEVLSSIEASSRQAVVELHRLLGFLRRADQPDELAPQPDLAQLTELVAQAGQGGLAVELSLEGEQRALPPTLEVSAYRVIQEALTNALKHSGGTTATVRVEYKPTVLEIEVLDDGRGTRRSSNNVGGHGLMGMRERVGLHGGHLRAGVTPQGGFAVHATFPLNGNAT